MYAAPGLKYWKMSSFYELVQLANTTRGGASATVRKPVDKRNRPDLSDEVVNPAIWTFLFALAAGGGLGYASMFIVTEARELTISKPMIGLVAALAFTGAGCAALIMIAIQLPEYRRLRWEYHEAVIEKQEPKGPGIREITRVEPRRDVILQCEWRPHNWRQILARKLFDDRSEWLNKNLARWMFDDIVTNAAPKYRDGLIQADLRALGWIDDGDNWTEKGRADLRLALFMEY